MELDDAYVALLEVLESHGPLAEPELLSALRRAGLSEWDVGEVLDYPPEVVAFLPDGRWVSLPFLLAPRRLTRRVAGGQDGRLPAGGPAPPAPALPGHGPSRAARRRRAHRAAGQTVRSMVDCLIAATALRLGRPVLHLNRDFELLAAVSPLELVEV